MFLNYAWQKLSYAMSKEKKKLTKNCHIIKTLKHKEFLGINKKMFNNPMGKKWQRILTDNPQN